MLSGVCLDLDTGMGLSLCMGAGLGLGTGVALGLGMCVGLRLDTSVAPGLDRGRGSLDRRPGMGLKVGLGTKGAINRSFNCHPRHVWVAVYVSSSCEQFQFTDC